MYNSYTNKSLVIDRKRFLLVIFWLKENDWKLDLLPVLLRNANKTDRGAIVHFDLSGSNIERMTFRGFEIEWHNVWVYWG